MLQETISQGDFLYHAVHGLCRVDLVAKEGQSGQGGLSYSLVPKTANRMKVRFVIAGTDMKASGFHSLVSVKEANKILDYLEGGKGEKTLPSGAEAPSSPEYQARDLASAVRSFSRESLEVKDQRKRKVLERSVQGLVRELAIVFNMPLKETAAKVRKSLGETPKINPSVLAALSRAGED
jgi:RNA polymerase-interacting CarD/CdnL/TRCF family regulator